MIESASILVGAGILALVLVAGVFARQKPFDQLPPLPGVQRTVFTPVAVAPPDWWAEALIPLD